MKKQLQTILLLLSFILCNQIFGQNDHMNSIITDLNGNEIKLSSIDFDGKFLLLSVGGTWCKPCLIQKPYVKSLENQLTSKMKVIYLFHRDSSEAILKKFPDENLDNYYLADVRFVENLNIYSYPTNILLNSDGSLAKHDVRIDEIPRYLGVK